MILPADEYTRDTGGQKFTRPTTRPKNYPTLATDATEGTRQEQVALLKIERTEFDVMRAAETGDKSLLITAYGDRYFRSLRNRLTGYKDVTLLEMLAHLSQGWAEHQATEIMDLQGQLTRPWSTDENILDYIEETKKIYKHLEHAKCTYVLTLKVTALLSAFERSGELVEACRKWQEDEPPEDDEDLKTSPLIFCEPIKT